MYICRPRTLPVPGFDNVCLLREPSQANEIATSAKVNLMSLFLLYIHFSLSPPLPLSPSLSLPQDKRVVVIGTSFIGMEVASYLSDKASSVECIDIAAVPFERVLGGRIGKALQTVQLLLMFISLFLLIFCMQLLD